jgi:hypothetical protein
MRLPPQPPKTCSWVIPGASAGAEGAVEIAGIVKPDTVTGGFRIGAPAASTPTGAVRTVVAAMMAKATRRMGVSDTVKGTL